MLREQQDQRLHELEDFLRTRRARLAPEDVGLPRGSRRRAPGLRRAEVAQLAAVSVDWYTWLEQGRPITVSTQVLESLVRALWPDHEVLGTLEGHKTLNHPQAGYLMFEHLTFQVVDAPELNVNVYSPLDQADTPAKLSQLHSSLRDQTSESRALSTFPRATMSLISHPARVSHRTCHEALREDTVASLRGKPWIRVKLYQKRYPSGSLAICGGMRKHLLQPYLRFHANGECHHTWQVTH